MQAQLDADVWQDVLSVRYLVASPARDVRTWLKFGALCRKSGRGALAHKILVDVLGTDPALVRLTLPRTLTLTLTLTVTLTLTLTVTLTLTLTVSRSSSTTGATWSGGWATSSSSPSACGT